VTVVLVSGTGTDVGKTVTTAALAACATGRVAVVKPAQTGVAPGARGDLAEVTRLAKVTDVHEFARYPDPLSPHHAAWMSGQPTLSQGEVMTGILDLEADHDLVLVEGAGGLLVPFSTANPWTLLDLACALQAPVVVVTAAGLGTINHTALTVRALAEDGVELAGIVIGSWPAEPDLAMRCSLDDLAAMAPDGALAGALPAGMATMADFRKRARAALAPQWGGTFDWRRFREANRP
jgi:dethiobiotin synthetase